MTLIEVRRRGQVILARAGADSVRVFGSVARDEADGRSDVDLLVDLAQPAPRGFAYFGLIDELQQTLAPVLGLQVHVAEIRDPTVPVAQEILAEALPL